MTRYVVVLTIDRHSPGTDVTDMYPEDTLKELERFGYLEAVTEAEEQPRRTRKQKTEVADA